MDLMLPHIAETAIKRVIGEFSSDSHNIFTPFALCNEVIDKIPSLDGQVLVVANLEFVYNMIVRGVDKERLYFATPCEKKGRLATAWIPKSNIIIYKDVLTEQDVNGMKFDVVCGNPPYQNPNYTNAQSLWPLFIREAFEISNGYVALVVPARWCSHTANVRRGKVKVFNTFMKPKLEVINVGECSRHFKEGFTDRYFSYFIANQNKQDTSVEVISPEDTFIADIANVEQIPSNYLTSLSLTITTKIDNHSKRNGYFSKFVQRNKFQSTGDRFLVIESGRFVPWAKMNFMVDEGKLTENQKVNYLTFTLPIKQVVTIEYIQSVFQSKLFKFLAFVYDPKDQYGPSFFQGLPAVDLTRSWTDAELYAHFNLTPEEIKLIEDTIK